MPESEDQRIAAAIAEHEPEKLHAKNRNMLKMSQEELHKMASKPKEKKLPKRAKKSSKKNPMKAEIAKVAKKRRGY